MADSYGALNDAAKNVDQQKAAALAALANGGTAGLAAYQAAQQANTADRQKAIQQTLAGAAGVNGGAPAGAGAELSGMVNKPFDQYAATTGALQGAFQQASATRQDAAKTYFDEAGAAVPAIRALTEQKIAVLRQQAAERAAAKAAASRGFGGTGVSEAEVKATSIGKAQADYNTAQAEAKRAQAAADASAKTGAADELANRENISDAGRAAMHGYEVTGPMAVDQSRQKALQAEADRAANAAFLAGHHLATLEQTPVNVRNQQAAASLGVAPNLAAGLFPDMTPAQQVAAAIAAGKLGNVDENGIPRLPTDPNSAAAIKTSPDYTAGIQSAATARSDGKTYDEWAQAVIDANANSMDPATLLAILQDGKTILPPSLTPTLAPTGPSTGP